VESKDSFSGPAVELRAGIVGAGFIGRVHARSARLAGARIGGVAASSAASAQAAAAELGAERAFATAEELVVADGLDVIHICSPNSLHLPLARAALEAGKHVVCEKPLALDADGAAELVAAAETSGRVATVPFVYRYYPTIREARARVRAGALGRVHLITGGYLQDWLLEAGDDNWRVDPELGGRSRAFADIGSHWCDLAEFVSGQRIVSLTARTAITHPERVTEDIATLMFETDGGVAGSAAISQVSAGRKNQLRLEIGGAEAAVAFDQEQPETLWIGRRSGSERIPRGVETMAPEAAAYVTVPAGHPQGYQDCFDAFVAETYAAIGGHPLADGLPAFADGLRAARLTEAVLESARTRGWVSVATGA
jgi:predicted dehydrogenase